MNNKGSKKIWWQPGLALAIQISTWIAGPIILAVIIGKWLDKKYNTEPWLFLISIGIAFVISNIGIVREALRTMKQMEKQYSKDKNNSSSDFAEKTKAEEENLKDKNK